MGGDDQLAQALVADAMAGAEIIKQVPAFDAQPCLQRVRGIAIDAGMDHFAVARTGLHAEMGILLQNECVQAAVRQYAGDSQAHGPGADHGCVATILIHGDSVSRFPFRFLMEPRQPPRGLRSFLGAHFNRSAS